MAKLKCCSKSLWSITLIVFMLSLASITSPTLSIVQAQGVPLITLDGCAGNALASATVLQKFDTSQYIGNNRSNVFHHPWCSFIGPLPDSHKVYFDSRDNAINAGYRPCKTCKP